MVEISIAIHGGPESRKTARALAEWLSSIADGDTGALAVPQRIGAPALVAVPAPAAASRPAAELVLCPDRRTASVDGVAMTLTRREYDLLLFLAENPRQVFSRAQLLDLVWQHEATCGERTVDVHVLRLRRKLHGRGPLITTVRGLGYRLDGADRLSIDAG
ncbi:winged helix-turn-helix domain-containing protein [Rugosimonospora africana]|uniref:OmpR/PhoB-type domain-containing protein n=1 Tax=Rugosimonospora africana TaxID=556532 RepID=A0A8J3QZH2_9ACTN|nr:winged helix-turn-helix domain-containing protein [Rugosimonospora africana]GIH20149.1 hypothetical protein Raf01_83210 [Rugosimonospora africana]